MNICFSVLLIIGMNTMPLLLRRWEPFFMQLFVESKMKWGFHSFRFIIRVEGVLASIELLTSGQFLFRQPVSAVSEMK